MIKEQDDDFTIWEKHSVLSGTQDQFSRSFNSAGTYFIAERTTFQFLSGFCLTEPGLKNFEKCFLLFSFVLHAWRDTNQFSIVLTDYKRFVGGTKQSLDVLSILS